MPAKKKTRQMDHVGLESPTHYRQFRSLWLYPTIGSTCLTVAETKREPRTGGAQQHEHGTYMVPA